MYAVVPGLNPEKSFGVIPKLLKFALLDLVDDVAAAVSVGVWVEEDDSEPPEDEESPDEFSCALTLIVIESETWVEPSSLLPVTFPLKLTVYVPADEGVKLACLVIVWSSALSVYPA